MYKYAGSFARMTCVVEMIHVTFAYSQSNILNMTTATDTGSVATPDLERRYVTILNNLSYCLNLSIVLSL